LSVFRLAEQEDAQDEQSSPGWISTPESREQLPYYYHRLHANVTTESRSASFHPPTKTRRLRDPPKLRLKNISRSKALDGKVNKIELPSKALPVETTTRVKTSASPRKIVVDQAV